MSRLVVLFFVLALAACSGSETSDTPTTAEPPAVETAAPAAAPKAAEAPMAAETPKAVEATPEDPQARSCLDLIAAGSFQQALPVCLAALEANPANQQLRDAVDQARAETGKLAAGEAAGAVQEESASQLGEAAKGLPGKLGGE